MNLFTSLLSGNTE